MGEVLLALKGEQLSSFIYTKSHFLPFLHCYFRGNILSEHHFAGWFIRLSLNLGHSSLLGLHPGLQDTVSSTNVGHTMAFFVWKLIESFLIQA